MSKQNLNERSAVTALLQLSGKITIKQARDVLKSRGLMPAAEDIIEEGELDYTRGILQKTREYKDSDGNKAGFVHLFERLKDGSKADYWKKPGDMTIRESVQDLTYWHRYRTKGEQRLRERFDLYARIHGRKRLLKKVPVELQGEFALAE